MTSANDRAALSSRTTVSLRELARAMDETALGNDAVRYAPFLRQESRDLKPTIIQCLFNVLHARSKNFFAGIDRFCFHLLFAAH